MPVLGIAEGQVVSTPEPDSFTEDWLTAWNCHDVDAVLAHFHDDVVFTSPVAARVTPGSEGVVRGIAAPPPRRICAGRACRADISYSGVRRGSPALRRAGAARRQAARQPA